MSDDANPFAKCSQEFSWEHAILLVKSAYTREEIRVAREAMQEHLAKYPADRERDPWHAWNHIVGSANERHEEAVLLGLDANAEAERDGLLRSSYVRGNVASDATLPSRIQAVLDVLSQWLSEHPEDQSAAVRHAGLTQEKQFAEELQELIRQLDSAKV